MRSIDLLSNARLLYVAWCPRPSWLTPSIDTVFDDSSRLEFRYPRSSIFYPQGHLFQQSQPSGQ
jgi:hypothetical protein